MVVTTAGDPGPAAEAAEALGASITWRYDIIDGFAGRTPAAALGMLAARDDVERIWLDRPVEGVMDVSHKAIEADKVWDTAVDGDSLTVAVIDTGIDRSHPDLAEAVVGCVSLIAGMESPECFDLDGHGTHVAGTVASRNEEWPGIARGTNLAAVRTLHGPVGLSSDSIAGMEWIQENATEVTPPIKVATMSLGPLDPRCGDGTAPSSQAADALVASGVVFTVAAGNSGHEDEDGNPQCTIDDVKARITDSAYAPDNGAAGDLPNNVWGHGAGNDTNRETCETFAVT